MCGSPALDALDAVAEADGAEGDGDVGVRAAVDCVVAVLIADPEQAVSASMAAVMAIPLVIPGGYR